MGNFKTLRPLHDINEFTCPFILTPRMNDIKKIDKKKPKAFLFLFYNKNNIIAM
jgi:hypothetical protein